MHVVLVNDALPFWLALWEVFAVHDGATTKKRVAMTAVIHSKNVSEFLLYAGIIAANQTLADRTRFEMSDEKWLAFQAHPIRFTCSF